jgi:elongation factor P
LISTADFKNGLSIELEGEVYTIVEFQHVKPGKGGAFVRTRLRHVKTGRVQEKTFRAGERMEQARLERRKMQYLYGTGDEFVFMDLENYDQVSFLRDQVGDREKFLKDGLEVEVTLHQDNVLGLELPVTIEATVVDTDPGLRGDTASGGSKPATIETGAVVAVPLFVNVGDRIRVDTRTGAYLDRVKS